MITRLIMDLFFGLIDLIVGLVPDAPVPSWLSDGSGYLSEIWGYGAGLGAWIPWSLVGTVFAAVLTCVGIGLTIKIVRIVASYLLAGGGSAG